MAKNYSAYEAAQVLMGNNVEEISEVGSRYPLFTRTVSMANSNHLLDILKAIPKVTARVVETGLKDIDGVETTEDVEEVEEAKATKKSAKTSEKVKTKKKEVEEEVEESEESSDDYESMTSKKLYQLCCDRGISSQCKKRDKATLIAVLKANEGVTDEEDDLEDTEEEEKETDPYIGKSARELYKMCVDRGIKAKTKQDADVYVKLLKKADAEVDVEEEEDDDDDWEI